MRMLELPCEIGDLVYEVFFDEDRKYARVESPYKVEDISVHSIQFEGEWVSRLEIGKTLFFDREEAVKACLKMNAEKEESIEIGDLVYKVSFDEEQKRATIEQPHKVDDISVHCILVEGEWVSRLEIGKTLFLNREEAIDACLKISYGIGWINIIEDIREHDNANNFD